MKEARALERSVEINSRQLQIANIAEAIRRLEGDMRYRQNNVNEARTESDRRQNDYERAEKNLTRAEKELTDTRDGIRVLVQLRERLYGEILLLGGEVTLVAEDDDE